MSKLILVTGGSGFLGEPLIEELLKKGFRVRVMARDEGKLIKLQDRVQIYTGDISDSFEVRQAMKDVNAVFHLAAFKHVGLAETFSRETVKTNIIGSLNIYEQSLQQPLDFIISISTDKAAQVNGVYGATKLLMERLSLQYEKINTKCKYRVVRYGNVLYSTGSVLCKWKKRIENGQEVVITDPDATRFFWTKEQAVQLIFDCLRAAKDSQPYCPEMKAIRMGDLLDTMIQKYSNQFIPIKKIGLQPGENKHERITENGKGSDEVGKYTTDEIFEMV